RPIAKQVGATIRAHLQSGEKVVSEAALQSVKSSDELEAVIQEVLQEIRPFVLQDGGDIIFDSFENGIVKVRMQGACSGCPSSSATSSRCGTRSGTCAAASCASRRRAACTATTG
ncbi:MAG: NifU family protein, partial [Pseudomonadota bacterium]|nr:NifU family protein [Pseudomonadota bacterium]